MEIAIVDYVHSSIFLSNMFNAVKEYNVQLTWRPISPRFSYHPPVKVNIFKILSTNKNYIHWKVFKSTKEKGKMRVLLSEYGIGYASF